MAESIYAIFKQGSKQYRVTEGDVLDIDLVETENGAKLEFNDVLFVGGSTSPMIGLPIVNGYHVVCEVLENVVTGPKISSIKYKPSHTQVRKFGHRQRYTRVKVVGISKAK